MKKIKYTLMAILAFFSLSSFSQELKELWASGSAVPNGVQKLTCTPDRQFRLIGELRSGEVRIQTTEKVNAQTKFLVPTDTTPIQRQISCNIQNDKKMRVNANIYSI